MKPCSLSGYVTHTPQSTQSAWLLSPVVAGCLKWQRENRFWISKTSQQAHLLCGTCRRQYWELESLWSKDKEPSYSQSPMLLLSCVSGTKMQGYTKKCLLPVCAKRPRNIPAGWIGTFTHGLPALETPPLLTTLLAPWMCFFSWPSFSLSNTNVKRRNQRQLKHTQQPGEDL